MHLSEKHTALLRHARTFGARRRAKPRQIGGTIMGDDWTMTELEERELGDELEAAGLLQRSPTSPESWVVTDAGRRAARGDDQDLTVDRARPMQSGDLQEVWGDHPIAQQQLQRRREAGALVRATLRAVVGRAYNGTDGWHITAYVTPDRRVGFVNLARGVACTTSVVLSPEFVEALTVPEQRDGVQFSGVVAWTEDLGRGGAAAPPAWVQLVLDLRASTDEARGETAPELGDVSPRIVVWGLPTCYSRGDRPERGEPGITALDSRDAPTLPIRDWPMPDETRAHIRDIGEAWLGRVAQRLMPLAGISVAHDPTLTIGDMRAAVAARDRYENVGSYNARAAARGAVNSTTQVVSNALRSCGVTRISNGCERSLALGSGYYELIRDLTARALARRLEPIAEALWLQLSPLMPVPVAGAPEHQADWALYMRVGPILRRLAADLAEVLLRDVAAEYSETESAIVNAYYANGPVNVNIPCSREEAR